MNDTKSILDIGTTIRGSKGDYRIVERLPSGMRGETAKAIIVGQETQFVVIKIPKFDQKRSVTDIRQRIRNITSDIENEATAWKRLSRNSEISEHIADFVDFGAYEYEFKGAMLFLPFIVQKYMAGMPLIDWCHRHYGSIENGFKGISDVNTWFGLAQKLMTILDLIHQERVVHGDIWPNNIIMMSDGKDYRPVLIDFGQAWLLDQVFQTQGRDQVQYRYYAPERFTSEGSFWYAPADIYSMSAILYYLATGNEPPSPYRNDENPPIFKAKRQMKAEIIEAIQANNPNLYYSNLGVPDIIMYGLPPSYHDRASSADRVKQLIEVFKVPTTVSKFEQPISNHQELLDQLIHSLEIAEHTAQTLAGLNDQVLYHLAARNVSLTKSYLASACRDGRVYSLPGGNRDELVNQLLVSLSCLQDGDEIIAMTTPLFWYNQNFGINGRTLTMLKMLSLVKNVNIRWLLMIEKNNEFLEKENVVPILSTQKKAVIETSMIANTIYQKTIETKTHNLDLKTFYVGYCLIDIDERDRLVRQAETFILLTQKHIDDDNFTLIAPTYTYRGGNIASLRFWRNPERAQELTEKFNKNLEKSTSIFDYES